MAEEAYIGSVTLHFFDAEKGLPPGPGFPCLCLMNDGQMAIGEWDTVWKVKGWKPLQRGDEVVAWAEILGAAVKQIQREL